jgi:hypothetical protein
MFNMNDGKRKKKNKHKTQTGVRASFKIIKKTVLVYCCSTSAASERFVPCNLDVAPATLLSSGEPANSSSA